MAVRAAEAATTAAAVVYRKLVFEVLDAARASAAALPDDDSLYTDMAASVTWCEDFGGVPDRRGQDQGTAARHLWSSEHRHGWEGRGAEVLRPAPP